ncbi:MAG: ATP-dependent Clp protease ATP-binding subunit, partial [Acidobacteria bacterium]
LVATGQIRLGDFVRVDLSPEGSLTFVKEAEGAMVPMLMERYGAAAAAPLASRTARPIAKPKEFTASPGNETK